MYVGILQPTPARERDRLTRQVYDYLLLSFTEPWEIKYGNIQFLAALVHDLQRYHPEFSVAVVDQVMEDIRIGMEVSLLPVTALLHGSSGHRKLTRRKISSSTIKDVSPPSATLASCTCTASSMPTWSLKHCGP
jgi:hypothetical protein